MHIKNYGNQGNKVVLNKLLKLLEELNIDWFMR